MESESKPSTPEPPPEAESPKSPEKSAAAPTAPRRKWFLPAAIVAGVVLLIVAVPKIFHALHTVSTDDAYVNSYVTFVAPRVAGQVEKVYVEMGGKPFTPKAATLNEHKEHAHAHGQELQALR